MMGIVLRARRARSTDGGFTLIECMVACMLLMILSSAVFAVLLTSFKTTRDDRTRVAASGLVARELEIVRQQFNAVAADGSRPGVAALISTPHVTNPDQLPTAVAGQPLNVGGMNFTVQRDVQPQVAGPGVSACDGGSLVSHPDYNVTVTATWPNMNGTRPVTGSTILTPPKGVLNDAATGYIAVKVKNAAQLANVGRAVTVTNGITSQPAVTDATGCAVVGVSAAGNYTVSLGEPGMVDFYGTNILTASVTAILGQLVVVTPILNYDTSAELDATITATAPYTLPTELPYLTLANNGLTTGGGVRQFAPAAGSVIAAKALWPFSDGYTVWAGSCTDANPAKAPTNGSTNPASVMAPGAVGVTTVKLTGVDVTVVNGAGVPQANAALTAVKPSGSTTGCNVADATLTLGNTDATGHLRTSLPNGKWQIKSGSSLSPAFSVIGTATSTQVSVP